jgi:hypothetical protein
MSHFDPDPSFVYFCGNFDIRENFKKIQLEYILFYRKSIMNVHAMFFDK